MPSPSPSKHDHAKGREGVDIASATVEKDDHAEVRAIVDKGFTQLMEWLDLRLKQQEDDLRSLLTAQEPRSSQGSANMELQAPRTEQDLARFPPTSAAPKRSWAIPTLSDPNLSIFEQASQMQGTVFHSRTISSQQSRPVRDFEMRKSTNSYVDTEQLWVASLVAIFDQLDLNQTGSLDLAEFEAAFQKTGFSNIRALEVFKSFDKTGNGTIDRLEWLHLVSHSARGSEEDMILVRNFLSKLVKLQNYHGTVYQADRPRRVDMILRHDSLLRTIWDLMLSALLLYVAVSVPVSLGFGTSRAMEDVDFVVDMIFCCDVVLNFRTSYRDQYDTIVVDWKKIGKRYLKSWFLIDFIASFPFEFIAKRVIPDLTPVRLLKVFKITKALRMLRITKIWSFTDSEAFEVLKIKLYSRPCTRVMRMLRLLLIAFIFAHWLACFCFAIDSTAFDDYFNSMGQVPDALQKYLAGMYWAMTTISTVGYGDITPTSDEERAYSMLAMVVGGSLYGFIVGSVTSIITDSDVHSFAYNERMEAIQSWLDGHEQIPMLLRRRLRKHFKRLYHAKTVIDDNMVIDQLAGDLRGDAAFFLIDEPVRHHPMIAKFSNSALAELVYVMQEIQFKAHECIVHKGDPGIGMYILVEGWARYDQGLKWQPPGAKDTPKSFQHITIGDSFGEEIIFGLAETYAYTVITIVDCKFKWIDETCFREHFKNLPELHKGCSSPHLTRRRHLRKQ